MSNANKPMVLAVDDEKNVLNAITRTLRTLDVDVLTASSGAEALRMMDNKTIDVILTDMRMPGMTGAEFLIEAKKLQPHSQRILLTGYADMESAIDAINGGGISNYLTKPWEGENLREVVNRAIRIARLEVENVRLVEENAQQNEMLVKLNTALEETVDIRTHELEAANAMLSETVQQLENSYETMVDLLANLAALPHHESESTRSKIELALAIGKELKLDEEALTNLRRATRLHRLGWCALPRGLTAKSLEEMTKEESEQYKHHPLFAESLLLNVPELSAVAKILRSQHETYEGSGFPERIATEGIPIAAKIVAVVRDYYDAINGRWRAEPISSAAAYKEVLSLSEKAYDPKVIVAFKKVLPLHEKVNSHTLEALIEARMLQPGMELARDLTTQRGALLLNKGRVLTKGVINTIVNLENQIEKKLTIYIKRKDPV
ncbi:MAG: adenylate cyclase [Pseudohongiellaceae bacterium]|jgi:adenylate cyclase